MEPHAETSERVARVLEILATAGGLLTMMWVFLTKLAKRAVRTILEPELKQLNNLIGAEDGCAQRMERMVDHLDDVLSEFDLLVGIVRDTRERQDETSELLNEVFGLERRIDPDRRRRVEMMFTQLHERRVTTRRRHIDE